jgi:transcriptional regulator with XRE-family HTH domain
MDEVQTFGEWIKQRRRTFDLTQEELARRVGCATAPSRKSSRRSLLAELRRQP